MRFSIFTPTHRPEYLHELFDSLLQQSFHDWEWVIIPNSAKGLHVEIPAPIAAHPQVRVIPATQEIAQQGIGALKLFACQQCLGDYFVEVDHDDLLTPDALAEMAKTADETQAGFIYSDFTNFYSDGTCQIFGAAYGWKSYPFDFKGKRYTAMRAFGSYPSSLHQIYYAPNHVRVWSREAYFKAGGHDPSMHVVDDHDLLCRTYLAGVEFAHIPKCLYLYRLQAGDQNSYLQMNDDIQTIQQEVANKYIYRMTMEWCKRNDYLMLDISSNDPFKEFKTAGYRGADIECDLHQGIPLPDNSVGCIRAYDFLPHVRPCSGNKCSHGTNGEDLCVVGMMNEFYRVLAPGGWLMVGAASTDGRGAFQDPMHQSFWNLNAFWYYTDSGYAKYIPHYNGRFQDTRVWQAFPSEWHEQNNIPYVFADLVALKGQEQPGIIKI